MSSLRGQDAWRRHPIFKWGITDALPGLREGAAAFGLYVAAEWAWGKVKGDQHDHHGVHAHASNEHTTEAHYASAIAGAGKQVA